MAYAHSLMAQQSPSPDDALIGLRTRVGQLKAWAQHAKGRLSDISLRELRIRTEGASSLLCYGYTVLTKVSETLRTEEEYLNALRPGDEVGLASLHERIKDAESWIREIDQKVLPVLSSRTRSDPKYDRFIRRFLHNLGFTECFPVTSHKQHGVLGLRVDARYRQYPIFLFSPSIRSFDALSLLYHEIGHWFLTHKLGPAIVDSLAGQLVPLDPQWPAYSERKGMQADRVVFHKVKHDLPVIASLYEEIIADAFAGLVGGHAFTSSLCNVFLFKGDINVLTNNKHPSAAWRIWLSRRASIMGQSPPEDDTGPPFEAWDAVECSCSYTTSRYILKRDEELVDAFLKRLYGLLVRNKVPCAGITERPAGHPSEINVGLANVPALLLAASKFRAEGDWPAYFRWERTNAAGAGLPWTRSLWRACIRRPYNQRLIRRRIAKAAKLKQRDG